jgi:2-hydroxycyclohexanecarboxyl-CoA dehydrogenase
LKIDLGLTGKTVIVTGGGSNIGRGIVLTFAREGSNIVNAEIDEKQGQKTVDDANALGGQAIWVKTDVTDWDSVQAMVKKTVERFGKIDVLVNNVGMARQGPFVEKSREECEKEISLNYWSVINCTRAVVDYMIERRYGKIINISSGAGRVGVANTAIYSGTKGAVISFSKALARELGRYGININAVCPGWVVPESPQDVGEGSFWRQGLDSYTPEMLRRIAKASPLGRLGSAQDIANTVVFLASEYASYITGQTISVDGGVTMV